MVADNALTINPPRPRKVVKLQPVAPARAARRTAKQERARQRQLYSAAASWAVALVLVGLSLSHLARGVHLITGAGPIESWAMAIGVDLGLIAAEVAILCAPNAKASRDVRLWAGMLIIGTSVVSSVLNAVAFVSVAPDNALVLQIGAATLGACIPGAIYALTRLGYVQVAQD